jgi:methylenetetrahydrofolate dehydrogenase (NADP+)/methenyltetrahydrofolate cyclohydrolase
MIGRSDIVGKPSDAAGAERVDATVTLCHSRTPDLGAFCRQADILVAAIGIRSSSRATW